MQSRIEKENDFRNFEKSRIGEGKRAKKTKKGIYNIAQNQSYSVINLIFNIKKHMKKSYVFLFV